jgi:hypothetical protein
MCDKNTKPIKNVKESFIIGLRVFYRNFLSSKNDKFLDNYFTRFGYCYIAVKSDINVRYLEI